MQFTVFNTNIRQKVLIAISLFLLGSGGISALSYSNLKQIEEKVALVEIADDLSTIVLEIRRTEKNLLLYGEEGTIAENRHFIDEALTLLSDISASLNQPRLETGLKDIRTDIQAYSDTIKEITGTADLAERDRAGLVERLRETGQRIMQHSKDITRFERADILRINKRLRRSLIYSMGIFIFVGIGAFLFMTFKIALPLKSIEQATTHIAKGDFTPLPVGRGNDEIQRVKEALNHMVSELEKRRDQLVQAQKLSSIGTLTSGIAHQLNNPLNNISTSCQLLMEEAGDADPMTKRMLGNIEQETLRARDIVRGLLEFSRHEAFSCNEVGLDQVVSRAVRLTSSQVPPGIELRTEVTEGVMVNIDFQRIQEALINLILNAVQAIENPPGEVVVSGTVATGEDGESIEGGGVLLTISDTGKGIKAEQMERIFDPFFTTKDVGSGTGLGLYVVYGIVKQHGGRIWATSTVGEGTTFHMVLPRSGECGA